MGKNKQPVISLTRSPRGDTRVVLFTLAGGRCEFYNCNRHLLTLNHAGIPETAIIGCHRRG